MSSPPTASAPVGANTPLMDTNAHSIDPSTIQVTAIQVTASAPTSQPQMSMPNTTRSIFPKVYENHPNNVPAIVAKHKEEEKKRKKKEHHNRSSQNDGITADSLFLINQCCSSCFTGITACLEYLCCFKCCSGCGDCNCDCSCGDCC